MDALGHRAREAVDGGPLAEDGLQVGVGERRGVDRSEALLEDERTDEGLLHGDLLVQGKADEQRHGIGGDELIGLV